MTPELERKLLAHKQETDYRDGWYLVDPELAEELLTMNTNNPRPLDMSTVERYATDMRKGDWKKNGETVSFYQDVLQNGQTRLHANIKAGKPVWLYLVFDAEETRRYDYGRNRSVKDELRITGKQAQIGTTILRFITGKAKNSIGSNVDFTAKELTCIEQASNVIAAGRTVSKIGCKTPCGAIVAAMIKSGFMDQNELAMFFRVVNTGNIIGCTKDPSSAFVLRRQLENMQGGGNANQKIQLETTYKALVDFKNGVQREDEYPSDGDVAEEYLKSVFQMEEVTPAAA